MLMISRFNSNTEIAVPSNVTRVGSLDDLNRKKTEDDMITSCVGRALSTAKTGKRYTISLRLTSWKNLKAMNRAGKRVLDVHRRQSWRRGSMIQSVTQGGWEEVENGSGGDDLNDSNVVSKSCNESKVRKRGVKELVGGLVDGK